MKQLFPFLLLAILSGFAMKDLFRPGAYTSHDLTHHIVRTIQMDKILGEGQFPPRWVGDLNWGYGYPLFLFNYPLPSIIAVGIHHLGSDYIWSVKLTFALSMIFSSIAMFVYCRYLFRSVEAGIVGGLFYLYAPIRFLNVYVSATFGNAIAFLFVPFIFWGLTKASRGEMDKKSLVSGALSLAGLILSHNIMALMFLPVIALYVFFLVVSTQSKQKVSVFFHSLLLIVWGLGLSAFFLLPAVVEKSLIRYDEILPGFYKTHFPALWQLVRSHWGYGFSFSGADLDDMSFQVGLAHLLVVAISLFLIVTKIARSAPRFVQMDKLIVFFLFIFFMSIILMLEASDPIWRTVVWLQYIQMPWRLLAVSVFSASVIAAWLTVKMPHRITATVLFSLAVLIANRNHWHINEVLPQTDVDYLRIDNTTTMASEHLPRGAGKFDNTPPALSKFTILSGDGDLSIGKDTAVDVQASITVRDSLHMRFNQIYFPGWEYVVDGIVQTPVYELAQPLPQFVLNAGAHRFKATFVNTPIRNIADITSMVSFIGLFVFLLFPFHRDRRR